MRITSEEMKKVVTAAAARMGAEKPITQLAKEFREFVTLGRRALRASDRDKVTGAGAFRPLSNEESERLSALKKQFYPSRQGK